MTPHEILNKVKAGVITQGRLSKDGPTCYYRHPDNSAIRCGVGHLIADEHYSPTLENKSATSADVTEALAKSGVNCFGLCGAIQSTHDWAYTLQEFLDQLDRLYEHNS